jgi:YD repeat-containing protein
MTSSATQNGAVEPVDSTRAKPRRRVALLLVWLTAAAVVTALWFLGPLTSGGLFLLVPPTALSTAKAPAPSQPLHKGNIDLATGLYSREDDDLIVPGNPPLVLRRTYLSGDPYSREFGVGTTHNAETYLVGDAERQQWVELILATGTRVRFRRVSFGSWTPNAMFEYHGPSEWRGATLGWTGLGWTIRRRDGHLTHFRGCRPGKVKDCAMISERDPDGQRIRYRRTTAGRLIRIEAAPDRWIAFEYDDRRRITRAHASTNQEVRYAYDQPGRLVRVTANDGVERSYGYSDRAEMLEIKDPGRTIENTFDRNGRCIRQITRYADGRDPYTFEYAYVTDGGRVARVESRHADGSFEVYTFNEHKYMLGEEWHSANGLFLSVAYDRDPATNLVSSLTLTCPDRRGRLLPHSSLVKHGDEDRVKSELFEAHCYPVRNGRKH